MIYRLSRPQEITADWTALSMCFPTATTWAVVSSAISSIWPSRHLIKSGTAIQQSLSNQRQSNLLFHSHPKYNNITTLNSLQCQFILPPNAHIKVNRNSPNNSH
jgi:hypothetical protein